MRIPRLVLAVLLLLVLALLVFEISNQVSDSGGGESAESERQSVKYFGEGAGGKRRSIARSDRKIGERDRFTAHSINLDKGESILLKGRNLEPDISEVIHLSAEAVILEDGTEAIRLLRRVIHSRAGASEEIGVIDWFEEADEMIMEAADREALLTQVAQTKGTDMIIHETLLIEPGKPFEAMVVPGEEELHIDGIVERGEDGNLRVRFGHLY